MKRLMIRVLPWVFMVLSLRLFAQDFGSNSAKSLDEWRWGVVAYNDGLLGKSLLAMERAVALNPTDNAMREWLGKSYWKSGMEKAALAVWDELIANDAASTALRRKADDLRRRLSGEDEIPVNDEWIPLATFGSLESDRMYFERPAAARSLGDGSGSLLISSYVRGEVVRLDANGALVERFDGGIEGLSQPFDILPTEDGRLLVSEFQADRISVLSLEGYDRGYRLDTWGQSGRGDGDFLGPQYMSLSPDGQFVYVSDWGNRRISKWRMDGTHVLNIETRGQFNGFAGPTGLACFGDRVYVADSLSARVEVFDPSGNYLGPLVEEGLKKPEGLAIQGDSLLIADGSDIFRVDLLSGAMSMEVSLGEGLHRITTVLPVENGNIAVCDFDSDRVVLLTPISTLYGGLNVVLNSVRADDYPTMMVDLTVQDTAHNTISGLDSSNFQILDGDISIVHPTLEWRSSDDRNISVIALVDPSGGETQIRSLFRGLDELIGALQTGDTLSLLQSGHDSALFDIAEGSGPDLFYQSITPNQEAIPWDESLRLAATRLAPERRRKAVVAFVNTAPNETAFDRYGLVETARLMSNNGIVFYPIFADENVLSPELDYIAAETGGHSSFLFQPKGSGRVIKELRDSEVGRYTLIWETPRFAGYGRNFMPVSVEVVYINKSGRDDSGTFFPLK